MPAAGETEAGFMRAVVQLAKLHQWLVFHPLPLRTAKGWATGTMGDAGFPDLTLAKVIDGAPRVLLVELKTDKGQLTAAQQRWVDTSGAEVWRPSMWPAIVATLAAAGEGLQ